VFHSTDDCDADAVVAPVLAPDAGDEDPARQLRFTVRSRK
jgi:hypothetical protein